MNLIKLSITRPIAVLAAVIMVIMFGAVAMQRIPIQLTPDVRQPVLSIETMWPGAAPAEVEREIVNRQEEALKGLEGLQEMTSRSRHGQAEISLEFGVGQDMDRALVLVSNRLDRVSGYPDEADEPTLSTSGTEDNPIAWFILTRADGNTTPMAHFRDFADDVIRDRIERVPGVGGTNLYGGAEREMQVAVDPARLAQYRLTVPQVVDALRAANVSVSAGDVAEGKRRYVVRMEGKLTEPGQVRDVVIRSESDALAPGALARVTVGDVATVDFGHKEARAALRFKGEPGLALNAIREAGANVIETMDGIRAAVDELNEGPLQRQGLTMRQVYDETLYIDSAIDLVVSNIYVGGTLAVICLMLFLRSIGATMVVALALPVSVVGAFVGMAALGRSLNVISLAGLAFAVGMVVDAAIVVLENIFRLRQQGKSRAEAAYKGASQVWGAILVSALTTVMVFIPILLMEMEVGQLFRDIAVAISVAVMLSLLVAITVIPALARRLLGAGSRGQEKMFHVPVLDGAAAGFVDAVNGFTAWVTARRSAALGVVGCMTLLAVTASWALLPKMEYLPEGNRNLVFGIVLPPPGYNLETTTAIARGIEDAMRPYWTGEGIDADAARIENFFFVALNETTFIGASAEDPQRAGELIPILQGPVFAEPGTFGFITQPSLFGRSVGSGRSIDLNITGADLEQVLAVALRATGRIGEVLPRDQGNQLRPQPGLELGAPEVRVEPDRIKLADNGVSVRTLGDTVDTFNDGLRVAEITVANKRLDLTLMGTEGNVTRTQGISELPVVTESGTILPVSALAQVSVTAGPTEIRHIERERTVTLQVRPSQTLALEQAMEILETEVMAPLRAEGLPDGVAMELSGTADKLTETWDAMQWQLLLALGIVYLVMAVLFESFLYPLVILFTVPLASAGAVLGLATLNVFTYQPLDMLTLLGFVILIGIVVNNAILLVHQTLYHMRFDGMKSEAAIREATHNRIRPIFMSTLTSLLGMLPLVLFPGAGSELYRGLGAVVLGGLALSAVLTLLIIPSLLSLTVTAIEGRRAKRAPASKLRQST